MSTLAADTLRLGIIGRVSLLICEATAAWRGLDVASGQG